MSKAQRSKFWSWMFVLLAAILVYALFPVFSVLVAAAIANFAGCQLDEASVHPCRVLGVDLGSMLYFLSVLGWLGIATLPTGAVALLVWLGVAIVSYLRRRNTGDAA